MAQDHAVITEERLEDIRARIGVDWRPREPYFNVEATVDTIRHFVHGIGDDNPVTRTEKEDKKHLVDLDVWGENQRGEMTTPGRATVQLPSWEDG